MPPLSELDRKILKLLLGPHARVPSHILSEKLGIPLTTINRRRKHLEEEYLSTEYSINLSKFGWRSIGLLISTAGGYTNKVAEKLLLREEVIYAARTIGEHTIDLRVDALVKENGELLNLLEDVKGMEGVRDVVWTEVVEVLGKKRPPNHVLDA